MAAGDAPHTTAPGELPAAAREPAVSSSEPAALTSNGSAAAIPGEPTASPSEPAAATPSALPAATPSALPAATSSELPAVPLVLYDGTCGFCARSVRWILAHERDHEIRFAPLQGPTAQRARERFPRIPVSIDTVVYIADGRAHLRSKAILHAARHLRAPWRWGYAMRWFPGVVLDLGYRVIAAVRYRIWGHADACQLVTPEQRARFLP